MNTITISPTRYAGAARYAKQHNVSIQQMVDEYLMTFQDETPKGTASELPDRWKKMAGILAGVEDIKGDDRLDYILSK